MNIEGSVIAASIGVVIHVILALMFFFATTANVLLLIIFYRRPALRTLSNRFVMSLLVFNLVATGFLLPLVLMDSLMDVGSYSDSSMEHAICAAGQAVTTLVTTGSISAALVIAVDQYCAVMAPLHYHRLITKLRAWLLLAGQWLFATAMAAFSMTDTAGKHFWKGCNLPTLVTVVTDDEDQDNSTLTTLVHHETHNTTMATSVNLTHLNPSSTTSYDVWTLLFVTSSLLCYAIPLALLTWMYLRIYSAAHRNSERTRRTSLTHSASELVVHCLGISGSTHQVSSPSNNVHECPSRGTPPSRTPSLRSTSSQIVHNLRYRISNASIFLYREEARAARVSVLVIVLAVFCWLPYHATLILHAWSTQAARLPSYAYNLIILAILLNSLSSPFLYAYRSRRMQREVRRLFGLPPKSRKEKAKHLRHSKPFRSLSPRRQLLRKQMRTSDALSADEVQAALSISGTSSSFSRFQSEEIRHETRSQLVQTFLQKMTRLWHKPNRVHPPAASELMAVSAEASRSSFSSATSSSSASAESDISL